MLVGAYFGEIEILFKTVRKFTVASNVYTEFLTLEKAIFETYIY
jgi:CRP-like cAMP-binding protein